MPHQDWLVFLGGFSPDLPTLRCPCADQGLPEEGVGRQKRQPVAIDFYFGFGWEKDPIPISFENLFGVYTRNQVFVWCPFLKENKVSLAIEAMHGHRSESGIQSC